jgi:hypothetical protein
MIDLLEVGENLVRQSPCPCGGVFKIPIDTVMSIDSDYIDLAVAGADAVMPRR